MGTLSRLESGVEQMAAYQNRWLLLYCLGRGKADVVMKAGQYGNKVLATETVTCTVPPTPSTVTCGCF
jgi:hypothetical protein